MLQPELGDSAPAFAGPALLALLAAAPAAIAPAIPSLLSAIAGALVLTWNVRAIMSRCTRLLVGAQQLHVETAKVAAAYGR